MRHIQQSLIRFFRRALFLVTIRGESAWPLLIPGKTYFATVLGVLRVKDFIVFHNPHNRKEIFVKRVEEIVGNRYRVGGLVSWASSSSDFGLVEKDFVIGKLLFRG